MQYKYRITKYDPTNRDAEGNYPIDEWTSFSDIGHTFNGKELAEQEYFQVEDAYVLSAIAFLNEAGVGKLTIIDLENAGEYREPALEIRVGDIYVTENVGRLFRLVLREKMWCKFVWEDEAYVHFGWDYYMYLGVPRSCPKAIKRAEEQGLFVEAMNSPYQSAGA